MQSINHFDSLGRLDSNDTYNDDKTHTYTDYDQANANPWSKIIYSFDAQGRLDWADNYYDNGTRIIVDYDQANVGNWSKIVNYFDAQGKVDWVDNYYDDGTRITVDYDQTNTNTWDKNIANYDAQGRLDSTDTYNDDKTRTFVDYDQANTNSWNYKILQFDAQGRLDSTDTYNDDKTRTFVDYDQANTNSWNYKILQYDAQGRLDSTDTYNDDNTRTFVDYDQANSNNWNYKIIQYDAQGRLDSTDTYNDDKTRTFVDYDQANTNSWNYTINQYDAQGRLDSSDIYNDDKTRIYVDYDQANVNNWSHINFNYDSQGRLDWVDNYYDDGTRIINDFDQANIGNWSQIVTYFDAQGRVDWVDNYYDDKTRTIVDYDQSNTNSWEKNVSYYDAQSRLFLTDVYNDDKSRVVTQIDATNAYGWSKIISTYDAQGRTDKIDTYSDNGTHKLIDYDQANTNSWSQISYDYDTQGRLVTVDTLNDNGTHSIVDFSQTGANLNPVLPSAITTTAYITGKREIDSLLTSQATWNPAGGHGATAQYSTTVTYAFQNIGAHLNPGTNASYADQQLNDASKAFYRAEFNRISDLTNLHMVESTSQSSVANGGADIRIFTSSYAALGSGGKALDSSIGGYTFLPDGSGKTDDIYGNIYLPGAGTHTLGTQTISSLTDFDTYSAVHELGHSLGLSHSFNEGATSTKGYPGAGFQPYSSTLWIGANNFGELTGGAQNSPNTDQPLESVMTYDSLNASSHTVLSADFGLWDVAALQHLYGANMSYHTGNDTYVYQGLTGTQTLWDAGGINTIQSISNLNDVINLNQGSFSRVGDMALVTYFNTDNYRSGSAMLLSQGAGQLVEENGKLYMNWNADYTGDATVQYISNTDNQIHRAYSQFTATTGTDQYNLAIDFGVNVANAIGGNGNDILIGNSLNNTLTGGAGRDSFNFSGIFGNDTITDFTQGQDVIKLQSNFAGKTSFSNGVLTVDGYGSIALSNVSSQLIAGTDYTFTL